MDVSSGERTEDEQLKEKLANEEYKIWKKHSPFIYDLCLTKALAYPSLTVQWFPDEVPFTKQDNDKVNFKTYSLLLGTQSLGGSGSDYVYKALLDLPSSEYDGGESLGNLNLLAEGQKIPHNRDVNKARYSPKQPSLVATLSSSGDAYIFDTNTYSTDSVDGSFDPTLVLKHSSKEGYGLAWDKFDAHRLATASNDGTVSLWNIAEALGGPRGAEVSPYHVFENHRPSPVNDLAWSHSHSFMFASANMDSSATIYDTRTNQVAINLDNIHSGSVNCVSFNPFASHLLATASADSTVSVLDLRFAGKEVFRLVGHAQDVTYVKWSPFSESVLASGGHDRRVRVWDLSLSGTPQTAEEEQQGPPELLFMHGGHVNRICEFDWHPTIPWTIASISEDNIAQVWQVASSIVGPPLDEEEEDAEEQQA